MSVKNRSRRGVFADQAASITAIKRPSRLQRLRDCAETQGKAAPGVPDPWPGQRQSRIVIENLTKHAGHEWSARFGFQLARGVKGEFTGSAECHAQARSA